MIKNYKRIEEIAELAYEIYDFLDVYKEILASPAHVLLEDARKEHKELLEQLGLEDSCWDSVEDGSIHKLFLKFEQIIADVEDHTSRALEEKVKK